MKDWVQDCPVECMMVLTWQIRMILRDRAVSKFSFCHGWESRVETKLVAQDARKKRSARGEGKVSKYEMRIIMRAYLAASRMQRSPLFFWHAPCLYLSIGLCSSLLRLPFMAYEPHDPPRRFIIQRLPNCYSIQRRKFRVKSPPSSTNKPLRTWKSEKVSF